MFNSAPAYVDQASYWPTAHGNGTDMAEPECPCLVQTSGDADSPFSENSAPVSILAGGVMPLASVPDCPICNLQSPSCTVMSGAGSTFLILVGDPGEDPHNAGHLVNLAAQTEANNRNAEGHRVIACRVSSVQQFVNAMTHNGYIDGAVIYFGHSGPYHGTVGGRGVAASMLNVGGASGVDTNVSALNVSLLSAVRTAYRHRNILGPNVSLWLNGCKAGEEIDDYYAGYRTSIAQMIANQIQRGVFAYEVGTYFSRNTPATDPKNAADKQKFATRLPIYMVPVGPAGRKPGYKPVTPH